MEPTPAALAWSDLLASWGIPQEILDRAPRDPWIMPLALFRAPTGTDAGTTAAPGPGTGTATDTPSARRAREALPQGGSVLDVGCGGGRAAFSVAPPAETVIGVDERPEMLTEFAAAARARGLAHQEFAGTWPGVAERVPSADVVVCHHVVYNVTDLATFARALSAKARRRVVLELGRHHPLAYLSPLWQRFWGLTRPDGPTAGTALDVLREAGLPAQAEPWDDPTPPRENSLTVAEQVEIIRTRLCLTPDRDAELAEALRDLPPRTPRRTVTLWWDVPER